MIAVSFIEVDQQSNLGVRFIETGPVQTLNMYDILELFNFSTFLLCNLMS